MPTNSHTRRWRGVLVFAAAFLGCPALSAAPALDWKPQPAGRSVAIGIPSGGKAGFTLLPESATGLGFTNVLPLARHLTNQVLLNGSGVAAGDVDGDGWCDLFFCGIDRPNALFRNLGGWKFADITAAAGVGCTNLSSTGAVLADFDGDGDLDLIVNSVGHGTRVFANDGKGRFTEFAVLNRNKGGMSLALGDLDGDGFLDLYLANYRKNGLMDMPNTHFNFAMLNGQRVVAKVNGQPVAGTEFENRYRVNARGGIEEDGELDGIFRNDGGKRFELTPFTGGLFTDEDGKALASPPFDWGLSVMIRDLTQDGLPDIWVCNDFDAPERIWINQGGGRFRAAPRLAFRKTSHFSMGLDVADINRDGHDDVLCVDMLSREHVMRMDMMGDRNPTLPQAGLFENRPNYMVNTLFLNRGDGTYAEIARLAGLEATEWSWATIFLDVDLDGWEDLLIANGHERAARSLDILDRLSAMRRGREITAQEVFENRRLFPRQTSPNCAFRNRGDLTFEDAGRAWGFHFDGVSHGMCLADLDNDGDLDVAVNNLNDAASVYRNESSAPRIGVRLKGRAPNTRGIGARITVRGGAVPEQSQEMLAGGRYLSSDDPMRVFAAGPATNGLTIEVAWRSGQRSTVTGAMANRIYEIDEASASASPDPRPQTRDPLFTDASALLSHKHHDQPFDDFARQPTLPNKLSQSGPGVTWADLDDDGRDELIIPGGNGGALAVFRNDGKGGFKKLDGPFSAPADRDQTMVLPWRAGAGPPLLLVGQASDELPADGPCVRAWPLTGQPLPDVFPALGASSGPLAMADLDGDGRLDLFVGGRFVPGRYPEAAPSAVFRASAEGFNVDEENTRQLAGAGLVSGALFSDLDGDGDADLVLACEWGPLRIFRNTAGKLAPWDWPVGASGSRLSQLTGWWTGIASGDFNGDGRLDLIAANWGRNTPREWHRGNEPGLLHADFNGDGIVEMVETYRDTALGKTVPERQLDFLARGLPFLRERFTSHIAFGKAGIEEILGERLKSAQRLTVTTLESMLFLNTGTGFVARPLPVEAQMAPAFGVGVADFDGDGREDVFLSQNFFATQPDTPRHDAGRGLLLRGDGQGGFTAMRGQESGLKIYGEQRGAAVCDYDGDGRADLAVAQNGAETKLYRNTRAKPGLRVRLTGPAGNPTGAGVVLRIGSGGKFGPAREVHAGSGYWSQDSATPVLALPEGAVQLQVRWPGKNSITVDVPPGPREVLVDSAGEISDTSRR